MLAFGWLQAEGRSDFQQGSPDQIAGLLEALGAVGAAVGVLRFGLQLSLPILHLTDSVLLGSRLHQHLLRHCGTLLWPDPGQLRCLLICERDDLRPRLPCGASVRILILLFQAGV